MQGLFLESLSDYLPVNSDENFLVIEMWVVSLFNIDSDSLVQFFSLSLNFLLKFGGSINNFPLREGGFESPELTL